MQEDRRLAVLRAIVEDYVSTREPVGSKALVERHQLGVSPATVRNDMAALEEEGLIAQPHTSAGRIPTDKGYRFFVDRLTEIKPMTAAERRAISTFLEGAHDRGRGWTHEPGDDSDVDLLGSVFFVEQFPERRSAGDQAASSHRRERCIASEHARRRVARCR